MATLMMIEAFSTSPSYEYWQYTLVINIMENPKETNCCTHITLMPVVEVFCDVLSQDTCHQGNRHTSVLTPEQLYLVQS